MHHFRLALPPFLFDVKTDFDLVSDNAKKIYGSCYSEAMANDDFIDYRLTVTHSGGIRRYYRPQARFLCDEREPFKPLNANQAYAILEWGMNWTVAAHELQYVIVHSAVLAKRNKAIIFPAPPGSGKSTLTAHLANNGWRLLSDEMALIVPFTKQVLPFVRPICLKNASIDLARTWFPDNQYSTIAKDTHKGDVIHMAPSSEAIESNKTPAEIVGIVYPQYNREVELDIFQLTMTDTFMQLVNNAFNFTAIGKDSFETVVSLVESTKNFEIHYNNLSEIDAFLTEEIIDAS